MRGLATFPFPDRFRQEHGISLAEHKELLRQNEWSDEEFQAGFQKGVAPRDGSKDLLKYEALVQRELAKGEVTTISLFFLVRVCVRVRIIYHLSLLTVSLVAYNQAMTRLCRPSPTHTSLQWQKPGIIATPMQVSGPTATSEN